MKKIQREHTIEDSKGIISAKSAKRKFLLRRLKTGSLYLISTMLCTLNNIKSNCLAGSNKTCGRILLISLRHIGDFICSTSVIRALSSIYPNIGFDVVVHPDNREIASLLPNVRNVLTLTHTRGRGGGLSTGRLDWVDLKNVLKEITSREYDALIILSPDAILSLLVQILFFFKRRPIKVCDVSRFNLINILNGTAKKKHWLDIFRQVIAPLVKNGNVPQLIPFIKMPEVNRSWCESHSKDKLIIGFCVGAGWKHRKWNRIHYLDVANLILQEHKNALIMIYGYDSEDAETAKFIKNNCRPPERVETFINVGMMDFIKSLKQCDLVLSSDSGPAHIASALAIPLLVIFGPQTPDLCAPRGFSTVKVYWKKLECSPCDQTVCFNPVQRKCMDSILPAEVFEGVKEIIQSL